MHTTAVAVPSSITEAIAALFVHTVHVTVNVCQEALGFDLPLLSQAKSEARLLGPE